MLKRSRKRSHDINQLAASIAKTATEDDSSPEPASTKNPAAVALGRLGGKKGGPARATRLSPEERSAIARLAAAARWKKSPK